MSSLPQVFLAGSGQRWESLRKSKKYQSLVRWFNSILDEYSKQLNNVLATYVAKKSSVKSVAAAPKSKDQHQAEGKPEVDFPEAEIGKGYFIKPQDTFCRSVNGGEYTSEKGSLASSKDIPIMSSGITSGSEQCGGDDEADGETNMNPVNVKRVRRMLSNRESARQSRGRKQAQVSQLRVENSKLLKGLTDITQTFEASVENRVLKANIKTLQTKVKIAEEIVKKVTGFNPVVSTVSLASGKSNCHAALFHEGLCQFLLSVVVIIQPLSF